MSTAKPGIGTEVQMDARPLPSPMIIFSSPRLRPQPQEREHRSPLPGVAGVAGGSAALTVNGQRADERKDGHECSKGAPGISLSPGERAGVRAGVSLLCLLLLSLSAHAQTYSIDWFTIDGGGGTSTGGVYAVSGTIGQPDAGTPLTNGQYSVTGGFWALPIAVQTVGAPLLTIVPAASGQATISWTPATPGFVLQESALLSPANWTNSPSGAANPITVPATLPTKFYRLRQP